MEVREFSREKLIEVYSAYCPKYFPKDELKPITTIEWLLNRHIYRGFGIYDSDALLGFAFFVQVKGQKTVLLDYYAILESYRNLGIGGQCLGMLTGVFPDHDGIFIESENPHFASNEEQQDIQTRRIGFYTRNKAVKTPLVSTLFGVHYRILYLNASGKAFKNAPSAQDYYRMLDAIYQEMFPEKYYNTQVSLETI